MMIYVYLYDAHQFSLKQQQRTGTIGCGQFVLPAKPLEIEKFCKSLLKVTKIVNLTITAKPLEIEKFCKSLLNVTKIVNLTIGFQEKEAFSHNITTSWEKSLIIPD
jgi:ribosomal protein L33